MDARKTSIEINYNGKNISSAIQNYVESFQYTDPASGESDAISVGLENIDKRWFHSWLPAKGDKISAKIKMHNWERENDNSVFNCGSFTLDDLSFSGRPLTANIGAVSIPASYAFKNTKRTKTWEKVTVKALANEIAGRYGIQLSYTGDSITINSLEQSEEEDSTFLKSVCESYGLAIKVYNNKIVIFDVGRYEDKPPVLTIDETAMDTWTYNTTIDGTYTGATIEYTDPDKEEDIKITIGTGNRVLQLNEKADSLADAERKAVSRINEENRKMTTMSCSIRANRKIVASSCINITGLSKLNGKYYVDKVTHNVGDGYKMSLEMHLVQKRFTINKKVDTGNKYTIKKGDTLWDLAKKYYGSGPKHTVIYNANKDVIEAAARAHNKTTSQNGHWIYPGTVITIP